MTEPESYEAKSDPTLDNWVESNKTFFDLLKGDPVVEPLHYTYLAKVDVLAENAGIGVHEYYERAKKRVGPLGRGALRLVYSEADDEWHITVGVKDEGE